ncbi:hypothetical protein OEA41_009739 [Lepraria neglecta]|uniref:Uncharacterized protein n=1 Tax=Lepraria neglecta TaxID=209136 RepID=A0AAE0DH74_9LECA|nr:hypothetical protein OEA41_009739 [Lepraria neglecta]
MIISLTGCHSEKRFRQQVLHIHHVQSANQEIQQLLYVISREQHIISYAIFAAKGQWKDLKEADEQNSNDREVDGKQGIERQSEGPGTEGNSFVNSED